MHSLPAMQHTPSPSSITHGRQWFHVTTSPQKPEKMHFQLAAGHAMASLGTALAAAAAAPSSAATPASSGAEMTAERSDGAPSSGGSSGSAASASHGASGRSSMPSASPAICATAGSWSFGTPQCCSLAEQRSNRRPVSALTTPTQTSCVAMLTHALRAYKNSQQDAAYLCQRITHATPAQALQTGSGDRLRAFSLSCGPAPAR